MDKKIEKVQEKCKKCKLYYYPSCLDSSKVCEDCGGEDYAKEQGDEDNTEYLMGLKQK